MTPLVVLSIWQKIWTVPQNSFWYILQTVALPLFVPSTTIQKAGPVTVNCSAETVYNFTCSDNACSKWGGAHSANNKLRQLHIPSWNLCENSASFYISHGGNRGMEQGGSAHLSPCTIWSQIIAPDTTKMKPAISFHSLFVGFVELW